MIRFIKNHYTLSLQILLYGLRFKLSQAIFNFLLRNECLVKHDGTLLVKLLFCSNFEIKFFFVKLCNVLIGLSKFSP